MEDPMFSSVVNMAAGYNPYDDSGPLEDAARQLEWDLKRLSDLPPVAGDGDLYLNGFERERFMPVSAEAAQPGLCASTSLASQLAAAKEVAGLTIKAAKAKKPKGGRFALSVSKVAFRVEIREEGLYVSARAKFLWLKPEKAAA